MTGSTRGAGAGRILATLILGLAGVAASAQNSASSVSAGSASASAVQAASLQNGVNRANGPSSRIILSTDPQSGGRSGQQASSSPPPATDTTATSFGQSTADYRGQYAGSPSAELGYVDVVVPHDTDNWVGPVMPDERDRGPRRLSMEERLRLRSDIRDASRNMYEHPRPH